MRLVSGIVLVSVIGLGCGDGDSGGFAAWKELCPEQARFMCEEEAACSPSSFAYESIDECVAVTRKGLCEVPAELLQNFGGLGDAFILTDEAIECYRARIGLGPSCNPPADIDDMDVIAARAVCDPAATTPTGTGGAGDSCFADFECKGGFACVRGDGGICGVCTAVSEGDSCEDSECGLLSGLYCDSNQVCVAYAGEGESCAEKSCDSSAYLTCASDQTCRKYALRGESCAMAPCDPELYLHCSATEGNTCTPTPRNVGDACPDGLCGHGLACNAGSCIALLGEGESCADALGGACDVNAGLFCDSMSTTCTRMYANLGEACEGESGMPCWQSACVGGTCTAYAREGEACADDFDGVECLDFLLCNEGTCQTFASFYEDFDDAGAFQCE